MSDYFDLGSHSFPITTSSENAQTWFDRGLIWCYGFNHEEAIRCFEKVVELDAKCAMGYWGITYAASSFYNKPWEWYGEKEITESTKFCYENIQKAIQNNSLATTLEQHLIAALSQKHPDDKADDFTTLNLRERIYAQSMRSVLKKFPLDRDIICLTAESMMNLTRWKLWDIHQGIPAPDALTLASIEILEQALSLTEQDQLNPIPEFYIFISTPSKCHPGPRKH